MEAFRTITSQRWNPGAAVRFLRVSAVVAFTAALGIGPARSAGAQAAPGSELPGVIAPGDLGGLRNRPGAIMLTAALSFVVQIERRENEPAAQLCGQIEHVLSGRSEHFSSLAELEGCCAPLRMRRTLHGDGRALLAAQMLLLCASVARAQDVFDYRVLLDTDSSTSTGCDVAVKDADVATTVPGIEQIVIMRVERTSAAAARVVAVVRRVCTGGSFGAEVAVDPGGWPVGLDNGVNGSDVVEGLVPPAALGSPKGLARVVSSATKNNSPRLHF